MSQGVPAQNIAAKMVHISDGDTCLYTLLKKQNKNTENVTKSFTENNAENIYIDCNSLSLITALQFYGGRGEAR